jgi:hypothetical protein
MAGEGSFFQYRLGGIPLALTAVLTVSVWSCSWAINLETADACRLLVYKPTATSDVNAVIQEVTSSVTIQLPTVRHYISRYAARLSLYAHSC